MTENMKVAGVTAVVLSVIWIWAYGFVWLLEAGERKALCLRYSETITAYDECMK